MKALIFGISGQDGSNKLGNNARERAVEKFSEKKNFRGLFRYL